MFNHAITYLVIKGLSSIWVSCTEVQTTPLFLSRKNFFSILWRPYLNRWLFQHPWEKHTEFELFPLKERSHCHIVTEHTSPSGLFFIRDTQVKKLKRDADSPQTTQDATDPNHHLQLHSWTTRETLEMWCSVFPVSNPSHSALALSWKWF